MRKRISFIILALVITLSFSNYNKEVHANEKPLQFYDLNNSLWAWDSIYYLSGQGVINGVEAGKFNPTGNLTRGAAAAILVREIYPDDLPSGQSPFPDVEQGHMFYEEILVAAENDIFGGFDDGTFKPDATIDRAAVAKILALAYDLQPGNKSVSFSDVSQSHWAIDYIPLLSSNGIIDGYTDGTFKPGKGVLRNEFAKMLAETLVHKDPSVWFTPTLIGSDSYLPDSTKSYSFRDTYGGYDMEFRGLDKNDDQIWVQLDDNGEMEAGFGESKVGAALILTSLDESEQLVDYYLQYPMFIGKTWENAGTYFSGNVLNTITSMDETLKTPAGTFDNLIEVTDSDGFVHYIAKGHGHIAMYEKAANGKMIEQNLLSNVK